MCLTAPWSIVVVVLVDCGRVQDKTDESRAGAE